MISRRLTKTEKAEILEAYRAGDNINSLAEKYNCAYNTINRTVKTLLSNSEYLLLKEERSKISNKKDKIFDDETVKEKKEDLEYLNPLILSKDTLNNEDSSFHPDDQNNQNIDNNFELIEPLLSSFDFNQANQKSEFEILHFESLPEIVYMIVDKKVELDSQLISDLPEWSFLPEEELHRNAILLFANQRSAKRNCSRNQRVIKIPNTSVFKLSKSYLISKGITRLILEDSIIALDN